MKQSSIEWLFEQYRLVGMLTTAQVQKAKAMHKEEIMDAVKYGCSDWGCAKDAEQYYNETFNTKEK